MSSAPAGAGNNSSAVVRWPRRFAACHRLPSGCPSGAIAALTLPRRLPLFRHALSFRGALRAPAVGVVFQTLRDGTAGFGGGQAAFGGFAEAAREGAADADHGFDDLVHRDDGLHAGHRELRSGESVYGEERVAL